MTTVAIVTGGSGGIGAATCRALSEAGHHVIVGFGSNEESAQRVVADCAGSAEALHIDVAEQHSAIAAVERAGEVGTLAVLVNNAGVTGDDLLLRLEPDRFDETIQVNLRGTYLMSRAALRPMLRARHGRIINMSSIVALRGNAGQTAYAAAKAGMIGFSKSLAREVGRKGVTVNVVAPGFVPTAMTDRLDEALRDAMIKAAPTARAVEADEVAAAVRFLASDDARSITGTVLAVDGGAAI